MKICCIFVWLNNLKLNKMDKQILFVKKIAGQFVIFTELEYEKYLIYGVIK